jgi:hypothetical protein
MLHAFLGVKAKVRSLEKLVDCSTSLKIAIFVDCLEVKKDFWRPKCEQRACAVNAFFEYEYNQMIKFCYRRRQICSTIAIIARYLQ